MELASEGPEVSSMDFTQVTPEQWEALAQRRIYFGHQSVGDNIVEGIRDVLADHPEIPLQVVETVSLDSMTAPGLYHARIGQNGDPGSKTDAFTAIVDQGQPAVGVLKYCYIDVGPETDPMAMFSEYQQAMAQLEAADPDLVIVHVTLPLTRVEGRRDLLVKKLRGQPTDRDLNALRNRYNRRLRETYVGKEPVLDVARIESTHPDGSRSFFGKGGEAVYILAPEYTDDGAHLNATGRRAVAEAFLAVLATLD